MSNKGQTDCLIGEGTSFTGTLRIDGSLQINGKFEGEIKTNAHLIIGTNGRVKTSCVKANEVTVAGTLIGDIDATEEVVLLETGRVLGNINSPKINLNDGVVVQGSMNITGGQKKNISQVVEESFTGINKTDTEK